MYEISLTKLGNIMRSWDVSKNVRTGVTIRIVSVVSLLCFTLSGCSDPVVEKTIPSPHVAATGVNNYRLTPNDVVNIVVFQEPDMTTQGQISRDGSISFPLIGQVSIGGLTVEEAQALIAKRLSEKYLVNPQVTLTITGYAAQNYTILGQVGAPGSYPIPFEEQIFTLPMAVARAGGNTRIGNLRNVRITRYNGDTISQFTVNMLSSKGQQFQIQKGDLIAVQETLF